MKLKILAITIFLLITGLFTKVAYELGQAKLPAKAFTGQEFFDAINDHRESKGLKEIELYQPLCSGLVERWQVLKEPETFGHQGFGEWLAKTDPQVKLNVSEVSTAGSETDSLDFVISELVASPGHRLAIEDPKATIGCAYAAQGAGVLVIAYPR